MKPTTVNASLAREIEAQPEYQARLLEIAGDVKDSVERQAPIGQTGDYIHSIRVTQRPLAVGSFDFAAHWVEYGSIRNPPYAPLRRGARAAGLRLHERPKS